MTVVKAIKKLSKDTSILYGGYECTVDSIDNDFCKFTAWVTQSKTFNFVFPTKKVDSLLTRSIITIIK